MSQEFVLSGGSYVPKPNENASTEYVQKEAKIIAEQLINPSAWIPLSNMSPSPKVQSSPSRQEVAVRIENNGTIARLRGAIEVKTGETLAENASPFTLPANVRPAKEVLIAGGRSPGSTATLIVIKPTGEITFNASITAGNAVWLDHLAWNLT